jgi:integrase
MLMAATCRAIDLAEADGWSAATLTGVFYGLKARSHTTLRVYFGILRSFIEAWAATRSHLREITPGDVDTVLEPLRGHRRYNAITALRSLFRFAKRRGLTFADPTRHLCGGRGAGRTVLPMTAEQIRAVEQAAVTPVQRLAIALAAVHAARPGAIRDLTLDDIDLPSRRITLAGHRQRLGELTRNALLAWLGYRRATWPDTANRHVLVAHQRPGHRAGLARLPRQAPAPRHLPRAHPAGPHPARSPGHRR